MRIVGNRRGMGRVMIVDVSYGKWRPEVRGGRRAVGEEAGGLERDSRGEGKLEGEETGGEGRPEGRECRRGREGEGKPEGRGGRMEREGRGRDCRIGRGGEAGWRGEAVREGRSEKRVGGDTREEGEEVEGEPRSILSSFGGPHE